MFCCGKVGAVLTIFAQNSVSYLKNNDDDVAAKKKSECYESKITASCPGNQHCQFFQTHLPALPNRLFGADFHFLSRLILPEITI